MDAGSTLTSRGRLLAAGKMLFARTGYEQTSTASIVREAGSSESQLVRYFGGKAGLLEAIFNESWEPLHGEIGAVLSEEPATKDAIKRILALLIKVFAADQDLAFLFLFEGRRLRPGGNQILLSKGFVAFSTLIRSLIRRGQTEGVIHADINDYALTAALIGAAESMLRDRLVAERCGEKVQFIENDITAVFDRVITSL